MAIYRRNFVSKFMDILNFAARDIGGRNGNSSNSNSVWYWLKCLNFSALEELTQIFKFPPLATPITNFFSFFFCVCMFMSVGGWSGFVRAIVLLNGKSVVRRISGIKERAKPNLIQTQTVRLCCEVDRVGEYVWLCLVFQATYLY